MQHWDVGSFLVQRLPREVGSVRLLGADRFTFEGEVKWRARFAPVLLGQGYTRLWEFSVDVSWDLDEEYSGLQFSTMARIRLPPSARRWIEGRLQTYNDREKTHLKTLISSDENISVYASLTTIVSVEEAVQLSQKHPPTEAVRCFYFTYKDITTLLLGAWLDGWEIGHEYRRLN